MTVSSLSSTPSLSPSPERRPNVGTYDDRADASFLFFKQHTIDYLAGLLDYQWGPLILRAIEHSDALYHAALAMGSVHKTVLSQQKLEIDLDGDHFALKEYTRALRSLSPTSKMASSTPVEIVLTACLLFLGFEVRFWESS